MVGNTLTVTRYLFAFLLTGAFLTPNFPARAGVQLFQLMPAASGMLAGVVQVKIQPVGEPAEHPRVSPKRSPECQREPGNQMS